MSNFTITVEVKPSQELVTLFAPLIAATMPKNPVAQPPVGAQVPQQISSAPYKQPVANPQYQAPVNPTAAIPVMSAPTAAPAPTPYPSNPAPVNPTYAAPQQGAPAVPVAAQPIAPTFPNAANSATPAAPVTTYAAPTATPGNAAPTSAAPSFAYDDLARAASSLMDAGKQQQLLALLGQFNIPRLDALPKERYGEFATALRQMGARI